jgi:hypothetical protein
MGHVVGFGNRAVVGRGQVYVGGSLRVCWIDSLREPPDMHGIPAPSNLLAVTVPSLKKQGKDDSNG